ncbi:hypothetical protein INR49_023898 [Caranx melampygus]|nr:hypothetical protein INR49_023898 [Caranx melampygus]
MDKRCFQIPNQFSVCLRRQDECSRLVSVLQSFYYHPCNINPQSFYQETVLLFLFLFLLLCKSFLQGLDFGLTVSLALLELGLYVLEFELFCRAWSSAAAFFSFAVI